MTDRNQQRTYDLVLQGAKVCKNCNHWMQESCPNAPELKWYQRKVDAWCKLSTCDSFSPNEKAEVALMQLTQRRLMGENITLDDEEIEEIAMSAPRRGY